MQYALANLLLISSSLFGALQNIPTACTTTNCTASELSRELYNEAQFIQEQVAKTTGLDPQNQFYISFIEDYRTIYKNSIRKIEALANKNQATPRLQQLANQLTATIKQALQHLQNYQRPRFMNGLLAGTVTQLAAIANKIRFE